MEDEKTQTLEDMLAKVKYYMLSRVHVRIIDNKVMGMDGSYADIDTGIVKYTGTQVVPIVLPKQSLTLKEVIGCNLYPHDLNTSTRSLVLISNFLILVNHNFKRAGLVIPDPISFIDLERVECKGYNEVDREESARKYLSDLAIQLSTMCVTASGSYLPNIDELFKLDMGDYTITETHNRDIMDMNPYGGLTVLSTGDKLIVSAKDRDDKLMKLFVVEFEEDVKVIGGKITNLCKNTDTPLGELLSNKLEDMGLLSLFLQPPLYSTIDLNHKFRYQQVSTWTGGVELEDDLVYIKTDNTMCIGNYKDGIFRSKIVFAINSDLPGRYKTLRLPSEPPIRKYTVDTVNELSSALPAGAFNTLRNEI